METGNYGGGHEPASYLGAQNSKQCDHRPVPNPSLPTSNSPGQYFNTRGCMDIETRLLKTLLPRKTQPKIQTKQASSTAIDSPHHPRIIRLKSRPPGHTLKLSSHPRRRTHVHMHVPLWRPPCCPPTPREPRTLARRSPPRCSELRCPSCRRPARAPRSLSSPPWCCNDDKK